jgi:hypothetical protein
MTRVATLENETSQSDSQLKSSCERKYNIHGHWLDDAENDLKKMGFRGWRKIRTETTPWIIEPVEKHIHGY